MITESELIKDRILGLPDALRCKFCKRALILNGFQDAVLREHRDKLSCEGCRQTALYRAVRDLAVEMDRQASHVIE